MRLVLTAILVIFLSVPAAWSNDGKSMPIPSNAANEQPTSTSKTRINDIISLELDSIERIQKISYAPRPYSWTNRAYGGSFLGTNGISSYGGSFYGPEKTITKY